MSNDRLLAILTPSNILQRRQLYTVTGCQALQRFLSFNALPLSTVEDEVMAAKDVEVSDILSSSCLQSLTKLARLHGVATVTSKPIMQLARS